MKTSRIRQTAGPIRSFSWIACLILAGLSLAPGLARAAEIRDKKPALAGVVADDRATTAPTASDDEATSEPAETDEETTDTTTTEETDQESPRDRLWTEVLSQTHYSSHDHHNVIEDGAVLSGTHLFKLRDQWADFYLKTRLGVDRNGDFWNNRGELGFGLRYRPFKKYGLVLFDEMVGGHYYRGFHKNGTSQEDVEREDQADGPTYWDNRGGAAFWQWWGRQPAQVEHTEYYWPFTGWRELYADAIYVHRAHDLIATAAYKEGLVLGRIGKMRYDLHLTLEGGIDTQGDFWNNYLQYGPGFRVWPFPDKDININLDLLKGHYYRGDPEDQSSSYGDVAITLSFSFEFPR